MTRAAPRVGSDRQSREVETRGRSRGPKPRAAPRADRAPTIGEIFFCSFAHRKGVPPFSGACSRTRTAEASVCRAALSFVFFFRFSARLSSFVVSHETDRLKTPTRRPIRAHHRLSPVRLSHLSYERTRRATNLKKTSPDARLSCGTAARKSRMRGRRAPSRRRAGSPRTRRTSPRTKSCRSPACRRR